MTNKKKMFVGMIIALGIIFVLTYYLSDRYFENKKSFNTTENKSIATQNSSSDLDNSVEVSLFTGEKQDEKLTLNELKNQLNLSDSATQDELKEALKEEGYSLVSAASNLLTFQRESDETVEPNKYYIGEKDGYLAIYKSDENGNLTIEDENDVYRDNKKVENLGETDKTKIRNFEFKYDTKEDAEEDLSEFLS